MSTRQPKPWTPERHEACKARAAAATRGPWKWWTSKRLVPIAPYGYQIAGSTLVPEARAIEAAQDERGHVDGARVFGGES